MTELQQKQLAFLEETVKHYNSGNRCTLNGNCMYSPKTLDLEGKTLGCAIGRHLDPALALELDSLGIASVYSVLDKLPDNLKDLGVDFLGRVQNIHDTDENWDQKGLSDEGILVYNRIKTVYGLEETPALDNP